MEKIVYPYLATRLIPPPTRMDCIPRTRLYEKLTRGLAYRLILLVAPAGSGKTTLLSGWLQTLQRPVAWVTVDTTDNVPVRFWGYFVAALEKAYPMILNPVIIPYQVLLDEPNIAPEASLASLINSLATMPGDGLIVLDDFHLVTAPSILAAVPFLIEHLPANIHLILVSRSDPPVPLPRLRARRQVLELRMHDLRFTIAEAH